MESFRVQWTLAYLSPIISPSITPPPTFSQLDNFEANLVVTVNVKHLSRISRTFVRMGWSDLFRGFRMGSSLELQLCLRDLRSIVFCFYNCSYTHTHLYSLYYRNLILKPLPIVIFSVSQFTTSSCLVKHWVRC